MAPLFFLFYVASAERQNLQAKEVNNMKWYCVNKELKIVAACTDVSLDVRLALQAITRLWGAPQEEKPERAQRLLWTIGDLNYGDAKDILDVIKEIDDLM